MKVTGAGTDSERLTLTTRLAFSMHGFFGAAMVVLVSVYMGKFYVDVVLLPAGLYAIAIAVGADAGAEAATGTLEAEAEDEREEIFYSVCRDGKALPSILRSDLTHLEATIDTGPSGLRPYLERTLSEIRARIDELSGLDA